MTAKKAKFQVIGSIVGHPDYPQGLERGDVLTLEVGDDGKPTSELFVTRTVPVGREVSPDGDEMTEKEAKGKAKQIIADAETKAAAILDKANADAAELIAAASAK